MPHFAQGKYKPCRRRYPCMVGRVPEVACPHRRSAATLQHLSRYAEPEQCPCWALTRRKKAMNREQWMWMRASVALMAQAAAAMRFNAAAPAPALPAPIAGQ